MHARRTLKFFDPRAASGSETRVRLQFQQWRIPVRTQVLIPGIGRVDMLVGNAWILETDSRAHHTGQEAYENDRVRDFGGSSLGFRTTRLTHAQVFDRWELTQQGLWSLVQQGWHRLPAPDVTVWLPDLSHVSRAVA